MLARLGEVIARFSVVLVDPHGVGMGSLASPSLSVLRTAPRFRWTGSRRPLGNETSILSDVLTGFLDFR